MSFVDSYSWVCKGGVYCAAGIYSCGTGQVLCIPGVVISLVAAIVNGILGCLQKSDKAKSNYLVNAKFSLHAATFFALGAIPVIGAPLAVYIYFIVD